MTLVPSGRQLRPVLAAVTGALATRAATAAVRRHPPGGVELWSRTNHAGNPVTLLEGPGFVVGAGVAALPAGPGPVIALLGGGVLGAVDDMVGDTSSKGFRGHLRALREGRVTTGLVKVAGLAATGLVAVALVDRGRSGPQLRRAVDVVLGGAVVAGTANLVNLLDLRPGRALKTVLVTGTALALAPERSGAQAAPVAAGAVVGAAVAALPEDLAGSSMLGDTGANAAGALLGAVLVARQGTVARVVTLGLLTAATVASERVSFTRVIEATPGLRELDAWGRPRSGPHPVSAS